VYYSLKFVFNEKISGFKEQVMDHVLLSTKGEYCCRNLEDVSPCFGESNSENPT
jgi:hypothetical protein